MEHLCWQIPNLGDAAVAATETAVASLVASSLYGRGDQKACLGFQVLCRESDTTESLRLLKSEKTPATAHGWANHRAPFWRDMLSAAAAAQGPAELRSDKTSIRKPTPCNAIFPRWRAPCAYSTDPPFQALLLPYFWSVNPTSFRSRDILRHDTTELETRRPISLQATSLQFVEMHDRSMHRARIISSVAATVISLACGT